MGCAGRLACKWALFVLVLQVTHQLIFKLDPVFHWTQRITCLFVGSGSRQQVSDCHSLQRKQLSFCCWTGKTSTPPFPVSPPACWFCYGCPGAVSFFPAPGKCHLSTAASVKSWKLMMLLVLELRHGWCGTRGHPGHPSVSVTSMVSLRREDEVTMSHPWV